MLLLLVASAQPAAAGRWDCFGDGLLRGDFVRDLPPPRDDLDRARLRLRGGLRWSGPRWELGASLLTAMGTESDADDAINLNNEEEDEIGLDRAWIRRFLPGQGQLTLGKDRLGWGIGPLVWDDDLRPVGASYAASIPLRTFDMLHLEAIYAAPDHPLEQDMDSRMAAGEVAWSIREGAPLGGEVAAAYIVFRDLDAFVSEGLARSNRTLDGRLSSEFELIDLRGTLRTRLADEPLVFVADAVHNAGADDESNGYEAAVVFGEKDERGQWEVGLAARRIQRDAVLAAFNSDDWWFHSATRGLRAWVAAGLRQDFWIRLAASSERRDDLDEHLTRVTLDLHCEF